MKKLLFFGCMAVLICLSILSPVSRGGTMSVVHSIDVKDYDGVPDDITWDGENLWILISIPDGHMSEDGIDELDPIDGTVLSQIRFPFMNHWGIAWDGTHLLVSNVVQTVEAPDTLDDPLVKYTPDGTLVGSISVPHSPDAQTKGVTWDGNSLWILDSRHLDITQTNPENGEIISSFSTPGVSPDSLTWDGTSLWCIDEEAGGDRLIYQMDTSGNIIDTWSPPGTNPSGLAFDGQYLWVLDNDADKIFQVVVPEPSTFVLIAMGVVCILAYGTKCQ